MDISKESLISLRLIACYEEFRGVVQELRVRVPLYDTACVIRMMFMQQGVTPEDHSFAASPEVTQDKFFEASALKLLTSALKQLGSLEMIELDPIVVTGVGPKISTEARWWDWGENINKGFVICRIAMSAIATSRISLEALRIFPDTPVCSVAPCDLAFITN